MMDMEPKYTDILVSVIIPVYNVKEYLDRCINSIRAQSHSKLEIILVDDGSSDGCYEICEKYAFEDDRIVVIHKHNEGLAEARNDGINIANGEWICFVDSDDFVSKNYVEYLLYAVKENNALLAQCKYMKGIGETFTDNTESLKFLCHDLDGFYKYCYTTPGHSVYACWINLYHYSIFEKIRFPALKHTEDVPTVQKCLFEGSSKKLVTVNQTMYYWFQRSGSIMNQSAKLNILDQSKAYEMVIDFWNEKKKFLISDIFFTTYFGCLIEEYTKLRRDKPEFRDKYEYLVNIIENNLPRAVRDVNKWIIFPSIQFDFFGYLENKKVVLYGYGENGRNILQWLEYFGVNIIEIWDKNATDKNKIGNIPLVKMHKGLSEEIVILLTVQAPDIKIMIKSDLINLGYQDIIEWKIIDPACRFRILKEFLPFLLGGYQ